MDSKKVFDLPITFEVINSRYNESRRASFSIFYGFHDSPFGKCFLALTDEGILEMGFAEEREVSGLDLLEKEFPSSVMIENMGKIKSIINRVFYPGETEDLPPFHLLLRGTDFQIKVWKALLRIPLGELSTYGKIAECIGSPASFRAVGGAVGANKIA